MSGGRIAHFTVIFGRFEVEVNVLNLEGCGYNSFRLIDGGGFGQIIEGRVGG